MGCWKWFDKMLKEAGIEVTDENRDEIEEIVNKYVGEQARYGRCSPDWRKAQKDMEADEQMKRRLSQELRLLFLKWIRYKGY